jgi:RNA recognition motif-containing protein
LEKNMNLYVGNLDYETNDDVLRDLFGAYGEVKTAKVVVDYETGRSKGFGFVEMANRSEAIKAISELNESLIGGRNIKVNEARQKTEAGGGGGRKGGGRKW